MIRSLPFLALCAALPAVEPHLALGPEDWQAQALLVSKHVEGGAQRTDDVALQGTASGRWYNVGLRLDAWLALDSQDNGEVEAGEFAEVRLRLDYLIDVPDIVQILPYYSTSLYPAYESDVDEPHWLGVEAWYLLPYEGVEFGGSCAFDADSNYDYNASIGFREFYQRRPLDLLAWQVINLGGNDYHRFLGADPGSSGLTTLEFGIEGLVPLPWENWWLQAGFTAWIWTSGDDRDARGDDTLETQFVVGAHWRQE